MCHVYVRWAVAEAAEGRGVQQEDRHLEEKVFSDSAAVWAALRLQRLHLHCVAGVLIRVGLRMAPTMAQQLCRSQPRRLGTYDAIYASASVMCAWEAQMDHRKPLGGQWEGQRT